MSHAARALAQGAKPWPEDDELVELMRQHRTYAAVAEACGKRRESLRDYLRARPELRARMSRLRGSGRKVSVAQARSELEARRTARRIRHGLADLESVAYERLLRHDPCSYCGGLVQVTDHIIPASRGGAHHWSNYTGACFACNSSKGTKPLLSWLLDRMAAPRGEQRSIQQVQDLK